MDDQNGLVTFFRELNTSLAELLGELKLEEERQLRASGWLADDVSRLLLWLMRATEGWTPPEKKAHKTKRSPDDRAKGQATGAGRGQSASLRSQTCTRRRG